MKQIAELLVKLMQSHNKHTLKYGFDKDSGPNSPIWSRVIGGFKLYNSSGKYITNVTYIAQQALKMGYLAEWKDKAGETHFLVTRKGRALIEPFRIEKRRKSEMLIDHDEVEVFFGPVFEYDPNGLPQSRIEVDTKTGRVKQVYENEVHGTWAGPKRVKVESYGNNSKVDEFASGYGGFMQASSGDESHEKISNEQIEKAKEEARRILKKYLKNLHRPYF